MTTAKSNFSVFVSKGEGGSCACCDNHRDNHSSVSWSFRCFFFFLLLLLFFGLVCPCRFQFLILTILESRSSFAAAGSCVSSLELPSPNRTRWPTLRTAPTLWPLQRSSLPSVKRTRRETSLFLCLWRFGGFVWLSTCLLAWWRREKTPDSTGRETRCVVVCCFAFVFLFFYYFIFFPSVFQISCVLGPANDHSMGHCDSIHRNVCCSRFSGHWLARHSRHHFVGNWIPDWGDQV